MVFLRFGLIEIFFVSIYLGTALATEDVSWKRTYCIYCKGIRLDSIRICCLVFVFPESFAENQIIQKTEQCIGQYSRQGLRTLVMAKRVLSEDDWAKWLASHREAQDAPEGRERLLYE